MAQTVKRLPAMWKTRVQSLGREDPLEKEMANHSSTLAWKILWTEEPGGLQSMGLQRVGHNWATELNWTERLLCPWGFPGKSTGVVCHFLLQGIFPVKTGIEPRSPAWHADYLLSESPGKPWKIPATNWVWLTFIEYSTQQQKNVHSFQLHLEYSQK